MRVGVLGATEPVGRHLLKLVEEHETFEVGAVTGGDDQAAGDTLAAVSAWDTRTVAEETAETRLVRNSPDAFPDDIELLLSALPISVAERAEPDLAAGGYLVVSNTANERLAVDVPLVMPAINPEHLDLLGRQRARRRWDGGLVKTPAASTITMTLPLSILDTFGLETATVATLHGATEEASAMSLLGNALPHISGEESKLKNEPRKVLGTLDTGEVRPHQLSVAPSCNRVPTLEGHLQNVWVETTTPVSPVEAEAALRDAPAVDLPSGPSDPITVFVDPNRPQPQLDKDIGAGQSIIVGPADRTDDGLQFDCLANEWVRGSAGTTLLNAELLVREGYTAQTGFDA